MHIETSLHHQCGLIRLSIYNTSIIFDPMRCDEAMTHGILSVPADCTHQQRLFSESHAYYWVSLLPLERAGSYRHQKVRCHQLVCVKLIIDQIQYYFAPTQDWSTDTTSWPRVDHMMRRPDCHAFINPTRSNNCNLWVAEWFICNDLSLPTHSRADVLSGL